MFDVFYSGPKPNQFAHERRAESIEHARSMSRTRYFWWITYLCDYTGWDWLWEPSPWQSQQRHAWASQWQKDSGTYLVPTSGYTDTNYHASPQITRAKSETHLWKIPENIEGFDATWHPDPTEPPFIYQFGTQHQRTGGPQYCVPGATQIKFVRQSNIRTRRVATAIYEIDHLDGAAGQIPNTTRQIRYFDNYKDTLTRLARSIEGEHEFVWICSSICDYAEFDFSWHPEQWQAHMLHVFPSGEQKFGDTFFMHVPSFLSQANQTALLEWMEVNYVDVQVPRRPIPVFYHRHDTHVEAVKNTEFAAPLALFTTEDHIDQALVTVPLWRTEVKTITPISKGASAVIVPRSARPQIKTQLYDYSYIDKTHVMLESQPLDIVFISNGEAIAEANWQRLLTATKANMNSNLNRIHRVDGINGRVAAYHAAARTSTTPWFFAVFAKLHVSKEFDWTWQPDRMQQPKHYIFHAQNPVNGLEYGHQAMIAYNKNLVLSNPGVGLDFTLDSAHEVVPMISGIALYNTSPWSAWRTAFREVLKLRASLPDVESEYRINRWLAGCAGEYGFYSQAGAEDAQEYYDSVSGDFEELRKSYEWDWLASYAFMRRGLAPDR